MNNKGFTLVELLATIAILGILSTVTIVSVTKYYEKSQENAVSAFEKNIVTTLESYVSMYGSKLFCSTCRNQSRTVQKCYYSGTELKCEDTILKKSSVQFKELYYKNITSDDLINPSTKVKCDDTDEITIYRDSDYVYCFIIEENNCSNKINTCKNKYKENGEYIFNE